jgi:outer membrane protein assembly factor BamB
MLQDGDAGVRLRTALALFDAHDREAIPVLINLLVELPREQVWRAEDPLYLAAGDKAPTGSPGADEVSRRDYKKQWNQWWQDNGKDLDLAKLEQRQRLQGLNLICLLDVNKGGAVGRVQEVDSDGKVKWQIEGLRYPVDAQMIGDDRVLICEYTGRQVSERNLKGEVQWTKALTALPITARRLANGNTFIATRNSLQELDKDGKEVVSIARPGNDLAAAVRLRNGDFAVVTNLGQFLRLGPEGKELKSFPVGQVLAVGGGIDVQPNGRVLAALYSQGKVVEFDAEGKKLWEADVLQPCSVARLPNGNVLVTSRNGRAVVEIDRTGKEVWKHTTDGMPMRASRR